MVAGAERASVQSSAVHVLIYNNVTAALHAGDCAIASVRVAVPVLHYIQRKTSF